MLDNYENDSLEDEYDVLDELTDDTSEADDKKDDNNIYKDSVRRFLYLFFLSSPSIM